MTKAREIVGSIICVLALIGLLGTGAYIEYIWWFQHPEYTTRVMFLEYWRLHLQAAALGVAAMVGFRIAT